MKPVSFEYHDPTTVEEAIALLEQQDDLARVLAGGQSLVPLLNERLVRPRHIIDINKVPGLDYIREADGGLSIGALTRHRTLERSPLVQSRCPLLFETIPLIGHPPIRNRGTLGGSLAFADSSAQLPAVVMALGAEIRVQGSTGLRSIGAEEFFVGRRTTALTPTELLVEVRFPPWPANTGWAFLQVRRRQGDFPLLGVAVTLTLNGAKAICLKASIVFTGVGEKPFRAQQAERLLVRRRPDEKLLAEVVKAAREIEPRTDIHASEEYRRHMAGVLSERALKTALVRAGGSALLWQRNRR